MLGVMVLATVVVVTAVFAVAGVLINKSANRNENT